MEDEWLFLLQVGGRRQYSAASTSRTDIRLARRLWDREILPELVETATLLASARRAARRGTPPLGPLRSGRAYRLFNL
jgi:hypothetical protein